MVKAKLNKEFIATAPGDITVFNYDGETREYLSSSVEYLPVGVGVPANSCTDAPGESKDDFAICRTEDFTAWEYIADHRGETVYSTETGEAVIVSLPGDYPERTTTLAPATPYDKWNGSQWITDTEAQYAAGVAATEQQKAALLAAAQSKIINWQSKLLLGTINDNEKTSLIAWLAYIDTLNAVDTTRPIWPTVPGEQAS